MPELVKEVASTFDPQSNRPIKLWAEDEARFGRMNNPKKCWAPAKIRPIIKLQRIREYLYVFAAVCPLTGESYSLIFPACNTNAMQIFLENFSQQYHEFNNIIIVDQAAWHTTQNLPPFENIRFVYLPSGSPELNPVEHLWEHLREGYLGNRIYNSLDDVENALVTVLQNICNDAKTIKSLTGFYWLNFAH
jgi:transposase